MNTQTRVEYLIEASKPIQKYLGRFTKEDVLSWLKSELGSAKILDKYELLQKSLKSKAVAPSLILHIVSGNTPHTGLQSLFRGLLVGAKQNIVKLPKERNFPEIESFIRALPEELQKGIETTRDVTQELIQKANVVIAFGEDSTLKTIRSNLNVHQKFIGHGYRISFAVIEEPTQECAELLAHDIVQFNQLGCLSPHAIYVKKNPKVFVSLLAKELSKATDQFSMEKSLSVSGAIYNLRAVASYQTASDPENYEVEIGDGKNQYTVIYENSMELRATPAYSTIYIRPWDAEKTAEIGVPQEHISTIAVSPLSEKMIEEVQSLQPSRVCKIGAMQQPHLFWHHDGLSSLRSLISWQDIHL